MALTTKLTSRLWVIFEHERLLLDDIHRHIREVSIWRLLLFAADFFPIDSSEEFVLLDVLHTSLRSQSLTWVLHEQFLQDVSACAREPQVALGWKLQRIVSDVRKQRFFFVVVERRQPCD